MSGSTSYAVSAKLQIGGNYASVMQKLGRSLAALDQQIKGTEQNLVRLAGLYPRFASVVTKSSMAAATGFADVKTSAVAASQGIQGATRSANTFSAAAMRMGNALGVVNRQMLVAAKGASVVSGVLARMAGVMVTSGSAATSSMSHLRASVSGVSVAAQGATKSVNTQTGALTRNAAAALRATASATAAAAAMRGLANTPPPPVLPRGGGGGAGGGRGGRGGASGGGSGATAGNRFTRNLTDPTPIEAYWGARMAGGMVWNTMQAGGAVQQQQSLLRAQTSGEWDVARNGMTAQEFRDRLMQRAIETTALVPGTTIAGNLEAGRGLRSVLGGASTTLRLLPDFQQAAQAISAAGTKKGIPGDPAEISEQMGRALSNRGSFNDPITGNLDPERGARETAMLSRMLFAYAGTKVNAHEVEMFQRRARGMGERMAPEPYFGGWAASGIQNLGGNVFGTSLNAFGRQFVTGTMTKENAGFLQQYGIMAPNARSAQVPEATIQKLLKDEDIDEDEANRMRSGSTARFNKASIKNSDLAAVRPDLYFQWLRNHLMTGGGIDPKTGKTRFKPLETQDELDAWANRAGGTPPARQALAFGLNPQAQQPDIEQVRGTAMTAIPDFLRESYGAALGNLTAGFNDLLAAIGGSEAVPRLLNEMGQGFRDLATWMRDNPGFMDTVVQELRTFVTDMRAFAGEIRDIVSGVAEWVRWLRGAKENLSGANIPGGSVADVEAARKQIWDTLLFRRPGASGAEAAPVAPSPGLGSVPLEGVPQGANPARPGSLLQLNSFQPIPGTNGDVVVQTAVNLDGRTIADVITRHQGRALNAPQAGPSFNDRRRGGVSGDVVTA